jgi:photosystem II stability/assembly factor-like uncharacterized protein
VPAPIPPAIRPDSIRQAAADRPDPFSRSPKRASVVSAPIPAGKWLALGPAPIGPPFLANGGEDGGANSGRITGLAAVASGLHPGRVVAASASGGIWTSDDNGAHWEPRTDSATDLAMGSVVDDPSNPNHLIAGTGEANQCSDCYPGVGILVSTDGGQTWSLQNPGGVFSNLHIAQVAIDPSNSSHEFAATDKGLFVTTNGGASWAKPTDSSYAPLDGSISAVVINPTTPTTVYLGGGAQVVGKSTDGGVHWAPANAQITPPSSTSQPSTALAIAPSSPSTLYASVGSNNPVALYKTINGGVSWSKVTEAPDYTGSAWSYSQEFNLDQGRYDNVLAIDPANANHVLAGGIALIETTDGGETWSNVNGQPLGVGTNIIHPDNHALVFRSDGKVWVGDDGGVFLYTPSSGAVSNANGNLNITQFYSGFSAVNGTVLAGSQDNGASRTSSELEVPWSGIFYGDGGPSAITPNEPATQFIQDNGKLYVTTDAFATNIRGITPHAVFVEPAAGPVAMIVVPSSATPKEPTVFYGGPDLWRTTNPSGVSPTWTKVTSVGGLPEVSVSAIAASAAHPNVVYVGFTNGVIQVSTDGGKTFASIELLASLKHFVTGLSVDPANPQAIAVSFSNDRTRYVFGHPHVALYSYTTEPGSGTWSIISGSLPAVAVSRVVYDNGALVAATDQGVYATGAPAGESTIWTRVGTEMPNVQVQDLDVAPDGLYAVTHGRGAWKLPLPLSTPPSVETNAASSIAQTSAALNATVNPNGGEVSECKLEYGTTIPYESSEPCMPSPGLGNSAVSVSASVTGLSANTTYHFRISATNASGTSYGVDLALTTLAQQGLTVTAPAGANLSNAMVFRPGNGNPGSGSTPTQTCPGSAVVHATCQATQSYSRALAACAKHHGKQRVACRKQANLAYHRALALTKCQSIKNTKRRNSCVQHARKLRS